MFILGTKKNIFFIDSAENINTFSDEIGGFDNIKEHTKNNNVVTVLPIFENKKQNPSKFQSSGRGCFVFANEIAKYLSFVPNDVLDSCVCVLPKSDLPNGVNIKQKQDDICLLDWKKLHIAYPEIVVDIFSLCQSENYIKNICKLYGIDFEEFMLTTKTEYNQQKNQEYTYSLRELRLEYSKSLDGKHTNYNNKVLHVRNKYMCDTINISNKSILF